MLPISRIVGFDDFLGAFILAVFDEEAGDEDDKRGTNDAEGDDEDELAALLGNDRNIGLICSLLHISLINFM